MFQFIVELFLKAVLLESEDIKDAERKTNCRVPMMPGIFLRLDEHAPH